MAMRAQRPTPVKWDRVQVCTLMMVGECCCGPNCKAKGYFMCEYSIGDEFGMTLWMSKG